MPRRKKTTATRRSKPAKKSSAGTKKGRAARGRKGTPKKVAKSTVKKSSGKRAETGTENAVVSKRATSRTGHSEARMTELRAMLEAKRAEVLGEIKRARQDSMEVDRTSFPEVGDLVSASVEKEKAFEYGEAGVNALREINAALEKLESGTYGVCEICGKLIGVKRLKAVPSARLCIKCKSDQEASGGATSGR